MKKLILLVTLVSSISGCTSIFNPIGEDNFDCNRKSGVNPDWCHSVKSAIKSTDGHIPDTDFDKTFNMEEFYRQQGYIKSGEKKDSSSSEKMQTTLPHQVARSASAVGGPVREAPVVMQIYIKSFVNDDDVLVQGQTVYKEVVPSRWRGFETVSKSRDSQAYPHYSDNSSPAPTTQQSNLSRPTNGGSTEFIQPGSSSLNQSAKPSAAIDGNEMPQ